MSKQELLKSATLLDAQRKKLTQKMLLAQEPVLRQSWERLALAMRQGADALRREAGE